METRYIEEEDDDDAAMMLLGDLYGEMSAFVFPNISSMTFFRTVRIPKYYAATNAHWHLEL